MYYTYIYIHILYIHVLYVCVYVYIYICIYRERPTHPQVEGLRARYAADREEEHLRLGGYHII